MAVRSTGTTTTSATASSLRSSGSARYRSAEYAVAAYAPGAGPLRGDHVDQAAARAAEARPGWAGLAAEPRAGKQAGGGGPRRPGQVRLTLGDLGSGAVDGRRHVAPQHPRRDGDQPRGRRGQRGDHLVEHGDALVLAVALRKRAGLGKEGGAPPRQGA